MAKKQRQFGEGGSGDRRLPTDQRNFVERNERMTQLGESHTESRVEKLASDVDPRWALGDQLQHIASVLAKSPSELLDELLNRKSPPQGTSLPGAERVDVASTTERRGATSRTTVIRNRTQVIRTSAAIISALEDVLNYDPKVQHNQIPPELWRDSPEYIAALKRIADELKALNDLLRKQSSDQKEHNSVVDLGVHINQFLTGFSSVAGKGAGWLLVASLGGLLYQTGIVPDLAENVLKHIKLPR
jgi:hypothetical protein